MGRNEDDVPALVALVHVFAAVPTHPRVGWDGRATPGALQGLRGSLVILIEICKFNHQVGSHDGQRQINLHLRLARGQLDFFSFVPTSRPGKKKASGTVFQGGSTLPAHVQREAKRNRLSSKSTLNGMNGEQF